MFLRQEQGALLEHLKRRSTSIADIYFGGLRTFSDEANPYRFQQSAHAFRELIAHAKRLTGGTVVFGDNMKQRLVPVKKAFVALKQASSLSPDPTSNPTGVSDKLNEALEAFFEWSDKYHSENRKQTALLLSQLAGAGLGLPSDVVADEITSWMSSDEYFKRVAHNVLTSTNSRGRS